MRDRNLVLEIWDRVLGFSLKKNRDSALTLKSFGLAIGIEFEDSGLQANHFWIEMRLGSRKPTFDYESYNFSYCFFFLLYLL